MIGILDDDLNRCTRFEKVLKTLNIAHCFWHTAPAMLETLKEDSASSYQALSLDHDLYAEDGSDAGDGLQIAQYLSTLTPTCPVIIHTSNADQSRRIRGTLEGSGWLCHNAPAIGHDWIEADWVLVIKEILNIK